MTDVGGCLHRVRAHYLAGLVLAFLNAGQGATFTVTTTADSGSGSLRQALVAANATVGRDTIRFQIPGAGTHTISPTSALPGISDPVVMDAATQPGYAGRPLIELNGASAGGAPGLRLEAGDSVIIGLAVNRFAGGGIQVLSGRGTVIQGNFLGTDPTGTIDRGNGNYGLFLFNTSSNLIGGALTGQGNVISGNTYYGIIIQGGQGNRVEGNFIGTTANGTTALGNDVFGLALDAANMNVIGGAATGAGNLISGNLGVGLQLLNSSSNVVSGNLVGVTKDGHNVLPNAADGIVVWGGAGNLLGGAIVGSGNVVSGNGAAGVKVKEGVGHLLLGNRLGTDTDGLISLANSLAGVTFDNSHSNRIGGVLEAERNLISGNHEDGVFCTNSSWNVIVGNFIGVDASGQRALANNFNGVAINGGTGNHVGEESAGNTISGNKFDGVSILGTSSSGNVVQGNRIGTSHEGTAAVPNRRGVNIYLGSNNQIGGVGASRGNLISGNNDAGVYIDGASALGTVIQGNLIGTDVTGNRGLPNRLEGILVWRGGSTLIGGDVPGAGNVISANNTRGINLPPTRDNVIQGNRIGTSADGSVPLGNKFHGVEIQAGTHGTLVGGTTEAAANQIAHARTVYSGIRVRDGATGNTFQGNHIHDNGGLGIDLGDYKVTDNDLCDPDGGANLQQNFPVLTRASQASGVLVSGELNSVPGRTYRLEFFANDHCDPSGHGEGQVFLGSKSLTLLGGPSCVQSFDVVLETAVPVGSLITATATDPEGNTSEFSACVPVEPPADPPLRLEMGEDGQLRASWPSSASGLGLYQTDSLVAPVDWAPVLIQPVETHGFFVVTLPVEAANRFYRLAPIEPIVEPTLKLEMIEDGLLLASWTNSASRFELSQTKSLKAPVIWIPVPMVPVETNGLLAVPLPVEPGNRFYRLSSE